MKVNMQNETIPDDIKLGFGIIKKGVKFSAAKKIIERQGRVLFELVRKTSNDDLQAVINKADSSRITKDN